MVDELSTSFGQVKISIIDLANLTVFFSAQAVGMRGTEGPHEVTDEQLERVAAVKAAAAARVGLDGDGLIPVPAIVSEPATYVGYGTDTKVDADEIDLVARVVGGRPPVLHKAYPGTLAACTAVAARIPGTTVHDVVRQPVSDEINIGHTSGIMPARARVTRDHDEWSVETAVYHRTARRIAEGTAFVRPSPAAQDAGN